MEQIASSGTLLFQVYLLRFPASKPLVEDFCRKQLLQNIDQNSEYL